jgi:RHS repeat-associated protein
VETPPAFRAIFALSRDVFPKQQNKEHRYWVSGVRGTVSGRCRVHSTHAPGRYECDEVRPSSGTHFGLDLASFRRSEAGGYSRVHGGQAREDVDEVGVDIDAEAAAVLANRGERWRTCCRFVRWATVSGGSWLASEDGNLYCYSSKSSRPPVKTNPDYHFSDIRTADSAVRVGGLHRGPGFGGGGTIDRSRIRTAFSPSTSPRTTCWRRTTAAAPQGAEAITFIYHGWNPIAEYTELSSVPTLHKAYSWGLDLSRSLQGAGGVGGLLAITDHRTATAGHYYPASDGNGNLMQLYKDVGGTDLVQRVARFDYDPFGRIVREDGAYAPHLRIRFSTKYQDQETGFLYYGYRWYDPVTGRWPSRDPISEFGGVNLYGFVGNSAMNFLDILGLVPVQDHHPIPHNKNPKNPAWNFWQHPLVKCANVDLEKDMPMVKLENHSGGHSPEYKEEVRRRGGKCSKCKARQALYILNNRLISNIESGHLRPYGHKTTVPQGRVPPQRRSSPFHPKNLGRAAGIIGLITVAFQSNQASAELKGQMRDLELALMGGRRQEAREIAEQIALGIPDLTGTKIQTIFLIDLHEAIDDYFWQLND